MNDTQQDREGRVSLTDELIDRFAAALKDKANAAEAKYGWNDGWRNPDAIDAMRDSLYRHLEKGDPRDVSIYCAFLWHHGATTALRPEPTICSGTGRYTNSNKHRGVIDASETGIVIDDETICPVCHQWVPAKGYLPPPETGRMWQVQEHPAKESQDPLLRLAVSQLEQMAADHHYMTKFSPPRGGVRE